MTTIGRHIPIYDTWSNEGGGRAIEEGIRYSERKALERKREQAAPMLQRLDGADARYISGLEAMRASFVERYGADALANKDGLLKRGADDSVTLSAEGEAMLADLAKLEQKRVWTDRVLMLFDGLRQAYRSSVEGYELSIQARADYYDSRFEKDDNRRADAYERTQVGLRRLEDLAAQSAEWNAASARLAGEVAASMSTSRALFASSKLFEFERNGAIKVDAKALANMGTTEAATSELARLIGVLTERNGMGQLRDALIGALNGQNRRIGELTGTL
jgi:hypothetical protein